MQSRAEADLEYALWNCKADAANNRRKILKFLVSPFGAHVLQIPNKRLKYCALKP